MKYYIGIDNGTSGSIGLVGGEIPIFIKTPTFMEQSYTKKKQRISRLDRVKLKEFIVNNVDLEGFASLSCDIKVIFERPFVNPGGFKASMSAVRCLEAQLTIIEDLGLPFEYVDSKQWQKVMLPGLTKGTNELKQASLDIGCRIFPMCEKTIKSQKDADGILIAEWARRMGL